MALQRHQESDDACVLARTLWTASSRNVAKSQGLHFQVDLSVDMHGIQRNVSEPPPGGVDVNARSQQVAGSRMSNGVGANAFGLREGIVVLARLTARRTKV